MNFSQDYEKIFFKYSLKKPKYLATIKQGFYTSEEIDILSRLANKFFEKFAETPSKEQMKLLVQNAKIAKDKIGDNILNLIYDTKLTNYDDEWLESTAESWIKWRNFDATLIDTIEYVKTTNVTPDNVDGIIGKVKTLINERNNLNFNSDLGLDFFNPEMHNQKETEKIASGYEFIDNVTSGGYDKASLVVYAGEQNIGKSIFLANDAVNFIKMGHNTAFISAEMAAHKVLKRIGSNALNIAMSDYAVKAQDKGFIKRKLETINVGLLPPGRLFIKQVPTSQATVMDIESYLSEIEETQGIKIKTVVIDYINILANYRNVNTENTYMKIKQIAEDLRAMAVRNDWLIITATQITRKGYDATELTMEHIAESAGLSHTADMMFGIIQDQLMHANNEYWLKILKIRDGEGKNLKCRLDINYEYMRLQESVDMTSSNIHHVDRNNERQN